MLRFLLLNAQTHCVPLELFELTTANAILNPAVATLLMISGDVDLERNTSLLTWNVIH